MLGLSSRSITTPLYTELDIMTLRPCRAILTLEYLIYVVRLSPTHYASLALRQQVQLYTDGHPCWLADLAIALHLLPRARNCYTQPLSLPNLSTASPDVVVRNLKALTQLVCRQTNSYLQCNINDWSRLSLLRGRREPHEDGSSTLCTREF
jgi:hypothetical protein